MVKSMYPCETAWFISHGTVFPPVCWLILMHFWYTQEAMKHCAITIPDKYQLPRIHQWDCEKGHKHPIVLQEKKKRKETILNEKKKQEKKGNAHIYNLAVISCLTCLLFICVNSPCSPVSLKCSVPLYTLGNAPGHWPCFGGFTWGIVEGWFFFFLPLWRLTVYNDTLDIKWKPESFTLTLQTPFT